MVTYALREGVAGHIELCMLFWVFFSVRRWRADESLGAEE